MEEKSNQATPQRVDGDRIIDAPMVSMDLQQAIEQLRAEPSWKDSDRNAITLFKSANMRIVLMGLHQHAELKTHTAKGIISVQVLGGNIRFTTAAEVAELQTGNMIALHENIPHSVLALEESFFLLTLSVS